MADFVADLVAGPWPCVTEFGWVRVTVRRSAACKQCDGQTSAHYTRLVNKRQAIKLLAWNNSPANLRRRRFERLATFSS